MMLKPALSLCALLLSAAVTVAADANLLKNDAFAQPDEKGIPAAWRGSGDSIAVVPAGAPSGAAAAKLTINTQASGLGEFLQRVPAKGGWKYRASALLRSQAPGLAFMQVKLYGKGKEIKRFDVPGKSGREWTPVQAELETPQGVDAIEVLGRYDRGAASQGKTVEFAAMVLADLGEKVYVAPKLLSLGAVSTFESAGITVGYEGDATDQARCVLRYRVKGQADWQQGLDLVHRPSERQFRGSVLMLKPGSDYEFECDLWDTHYAAKSPLATRATAARTWSGEVPIAKTVRLPAGTTRMPLVINDKGNENGWILYTSSAPGESTIDAGNDAASAVTIKDAAYVILDNLTVRGGASRGVMVEDSHHIRVRRCDVAGYGNPGTRNLEAKDKRYVKDDGKVLDWQAGVHVGSGSSQVVVEENFIHAPRGTANSWAHGHPAGVQGVILAMSDGNNVVRDNDIIGDEKHWWNDGIESLFNERVQGGPHRDTDISGNIIAFANDDGTELDGGQINVRYFNNWVQWTYCGVSCTPNLSGPSYVFRNLFVLDGEQRGLTNFGFKMGGDRYPNAGRAFLLHNTMVSTNLGLSTGHMGAGGTPITARNNVYLAGEIFLRGDLANYDLDYDLLRPQTLSPQKGPQEAHAIHGVPTFVDAASGDYRLATGSKGVDAAVLLPGVNEHFAGKAPDMGAFEDGVEATFPQRRAAISALPQMVRLDSAGKTQATVSICIPPQLGSRWRAHSNSAWLTCEPAEGQTGAQAQPLTLRAATMPVGEYRGAITFRTDSGHNRSVLVSFKARHAAPFALTVEAEKGDLAGSFTRVDDPSASGGAYLQTPANYQQAQGGGVSFTFDVPADDIYYMQAKTRVPADAAMNHDSFFVAVDAGEKVQWHLQHLGSPDFHWLRVSDIRSEERSKPFRLAKGRHTFHVYPREPLASLDSVRISNEPFLPD